MPKISFVVPVKNGEDFIEDTIKSIQKQTFQDFEIIIVNDHCQDSTVERVANLSKTDPRIIIINLVENTGIAAGRNAGTKVAKGDIILPTDADDPSYPTRAELSITELETNNADVFYGNVERFYTDTKKRELRHFQPYDQKMFRYINYIAHGASAFRREVFEKAKTYDAEFKIGEDYDFFLTAQENGFKFCSKNIPVSQYSMHSGQITSSLDPTKISERQKWNRAIREKHNIYDIDLKYVETHATPEIVDFYVNKNFNIWFSEKSIPKKLA